MKRRASRPQVERIEERVLTTVAGSAVALPLVGQSSEHPEHRTWVLINFLNNTNHDVQFRLTFTLGHQVHYVGEFHFPPNGRLHLNDGALSFLVPGPLPHYSVTFQASPHRRITEPITPRHFDHQPTPAEISSNIFPSTYVFTKNIKGDIVLVKRIDHIPL